MVKTYQVKLDIFEGPLDLLLHLINKYEIDIYDIPMAEITSQYTNYIHTMQQLELDIASEYLVMAATLVSIKSEMLLPKQRLEADLEEYEEDPREDLMRRLIEYRKYKEAAEQLKVKEAKEKQTFTRARTVLKGNLNSAPMKQGDVSVYDMISALSKMFERKSWDRPLETRVTRREIPIEQRMEEIIDITKNHKEGISFDKLFPYQSRSHIVVTFIALLELMKDNQVYCEQANHFEFLYVFYQE